MKKLFMVVMILLALNFLALGGGVGWLWQSGHLNKAKMVELKNVLFPPLAAAATQPSDNSAASKVDALAQLLEKQSGHSATEQVQFIQKTFDAQMLQVDRRQRELADLQRQVDLANQKLKVDRDNLEKQKKAIADRQQQAAQQETDKGFQDCLALYQSMPARQVKTLFMGMNEQLVTQYLDAMAPRNATKIIKEFKTPDETAFIAKVLETMRAPEATAASSTTAGPGSGAPPAAK